MNMVHQRIKTIAAEIGVVDIRKIENIFKGYKFSMSELIRESLRSSVLVLEGEEGPINFLKSARSHDVEFFLQK